MRKQACTRDEKICKRIWTGIFLAPWILLLVCCCALPFALNKSFEDHCYSTSDPGEYMSYNVNYAGGQAWLAASPFFPERIEAHFADVTYSFRAEDYDVYGYEMYLEFTIADPDVFTSHLEAIAPADAWQVFAYDEAYLEYVFSDSLGLVVTDPEGNPYDAPGILQADIRKILYSPAQQRIIYVALGVHDGGGATTDFLGTYFDRFQIDPTVYPQGGSNG